MSKVKLLLRILCGVIMIPAVIYWWVIEPFKVLLNPGKDPITFWVIVFGLFVLLFYIIKVIVNNPPKKEKRWTLWEFKSKYNSMILRGVVGEHQYLCFSGAIFRKDAVVDCGDFVFMNKNDVLSERNLLIIQLPSGKYILYKGEA